MNAAQKKRRSLSAVQKKRRHIKASAKQRGIHFSMTARDVAFLLSSTHCQKCGKRFGDLNQLSFDRKDPLQGYVKDNVVAMCVRCNSLKGGSEDQALWDSYKLWVTPHSQILQMVRRSLNSFAAAELDEEWE